MWRADGQPLVKGDPLGDVLRGGLSDCTLVLLPGRPHTMWCDTRVSSASSIGRALTDIPELHIVDAGAAVGRSEELISAWSVVGSCAHSVADWCRATMRNESEVTKMGCRHVGLRPPGSGSCAFYAEGVLLGGPPMAILKIKHAVKAAAPEIQREQRHKAPRIAVARMALIHSAWRMLRSGNRSGLSMFQSGALVHDALGRYSAGVEGPCLALLRVRLRAASGEENRQATSRRALPMPHAPRMIQSRSRLWTLGRRVLRISRSQLGSARDERRQSSDYDGGAVSEECGLNNPSSCRGSSDYCCAFLGGPSGHSGGKRAARGAPLSRPKWAAPEPDGIRFVARAAVARSCCFQLRGTWAEDVDVGGLNESMMALLPKG